MVIDAVRESPSMSATRGSLGKTALLPSLASAPSKRSKERARGGTMGSPTLNEWGYSCRLVDLIPKLL